VTDHRNVTDRPATPGFREIRLHDGPVAIESVTPFPPQCGAETIFVGRTRAERHIDHGDLVALEYHAYESMAIAVLTRLANAATLVYGVRAVRLLHAVGTVPIGEASVVVQVATGHREASFAACRTLIDRLKLEAPIWKREKWRDGTTWAEGVPVEGTPIDSPRTR